MTTHVIPQSGSQAIEALAAMLALAPHEADAIREARQAAMAAANVFEPLRSPTAAAIAACIAALRTRASEVRRAPAPVAQPPGTQPLPEVAFHEKRTMAVPTPTQEQVQEAVEEAAVREPVHWGATERLLYDDILNLFELGDQAGAMTSLERLIMLSPHAEELNLFLDKNGSLLQRLYTEHLGSLDRVPVPVRDARPVKIPTSFAPIVLDILRLADGHRTVREIVKRSKFGDVPTLATVAHLGRSGFVELA
jgi:hypothetical protein